MLKLLEKYEEKTGVQFVHHSGRMYILTSIANSESTDFNKFPPTAVYSSMEDGAEWARPLLDFDKNFTEMEPISCDGCGAIGPHVRSDGFGFNCCYNPCDEYTVRGISRSDFY